MAKTLTTRFANWTASLTLDAVDRSALWVDRINRKIVVSLQRTFRRK